MSTEAGDTIPIEDRAKSMGWAPKEEWRGSPDKWIDAEAFVTRGEEILPILRATNRHLQDDVSALKNELSATKAALQNSAAAIEELKKFNSDANRAKMKESKEALVKQLKEARAEGNVEAEVEINDQLDSVRAAERDSEKPPAPSTKPNGTEADPRNNPEYQAWIADNPWFESNSRKRALAVAIAAEMRQDPQYAGVTGRKFFDIVTQETEKTLGTPPPQPRKITKVEGSGQLGGDSGPPRSFADLPAEAKAGCDKMGERLIGPANKGFAYATLKDWREAYTTKYFEGE